MTSRPRHLCLNVLHSTRDPRKWPSLHSFKIALHINTKSGLLRYIGSFGYLILCSFLNSTCRSFDNCSDISRNWRHPRPSSHQGVIQGPRATKAIRQKHFGLTLHSLHWPTRTQRYTIFHRFCQSNLTFHNNGEHLTTIMLTAVFVNSWTPLLLSTLAVEHPDG